MGISIQNFTQLGGQADFYVLLFWPDAISHFVQILEEV
jgi:hypothetical protein